MFSVFQEVFCGEIIKFFLVFPSSYNLQQVSEVSAWENSSITLVLTEMVKLRRTEEEDSRDGRKIIKQSVSNMLSCLSQYILDEVCMFHYL